MCATKISKFKTSKTELENLLIQKAYHADENFLSDLAWSLSYP